MKQVPLEKGRPIPHIIQQQSQRTLLVRRQQGKGKNAWIRMGQQVPKHSERRNFWASETGGSLQKHTGGSGNRSKWINKVPYRLNEWTYVELEQARNFQR